jgi:hypothetical protein
MNGAIGRIERLTLVAVAIALAWLTYRFLEKPIRRSKRVITPLLLLAGVLLSGLVGLILYKANFANDLRYADYVAAKAEIRNRYFLGATFDGRTIDAFTLKGVSNDAVLFVGDSHMGQYYPAVEELYGDKANLPYYTAVFVSHANCTPSPDSLLESGDNNSQHFKCNDMYREIIRMADAPDVKRIVFGGNWQLAPNYSQSSLRAFGDSIKDLVAKKKRIVVILDNPQGTEFDPLVIMRRHRLNRYLALPNFPLTGDRYLNIDIPRRASWWRMGKLPGIVKSSGARIIDPYDFFCSSRGCPIVLDGKPTHVDSDHLRAFYVKQRATFMRALLSQ